VRTHQPNYMASQPRRPQYGYFLPWEPGIPYLSTPCHHPFTFSMRFSYLKSSCNSCVPMYAQPSSPTWPPFLTLAAEKGEWSASRPGRFTPCERASSAHWIGDWVGLRTGMDAVE
jgi:hypothetical protein